MPPHGSPLRLAITNVHAPAHFANYPTINTGSPDNTLAASPIQDISHLMHKPASVLSAVPRRSFSNNGHAKPGLTIRTTGFSSVPYDGLYGGANDLRPACIKRRPDLGDIPPSPPVMNPADLLDSSLPFDMLNDSVNAAPVTPPSPYMSPIGHRATAICRPSGLARELQSMHVDDVDMRE
jgi:hypothetical protein